MSRVPPFPTRRRSPSVTNGSSYPSPSSYASQPFSAPGISTRPLQISRPPSRPTTPSNSAFASGSPLHATPNTAPIGPSRPQRSELRGRVSEYSGSERASISSQDLYRDSISTTRSDFSASHQTANAPLHLRSDQPHQSPTSDDGEHTTPTSLVSALSAFQSAGSRRRQTLNAEDADHRRERELEMEAEKLRQQRIREKAPGVRAKRGGTKAGEIDAVLDQVKDGWEFVINPDFNNVELALQLLDSSSHGKNMESFRNTKNMLSKALRGSVDKHYQAFAASLPHHASLLNHLGESQTHISSTRTSLTVAKDALASKRADLVQLWNRAQTLEEMLRVLDQIEHLKRVPDLLETLMSEKRLLQASVLLVKSLKIINNSDMLEVGAISDLRSYLNGQETALREVLTDELQCHLYLKSFWCDTRWAAYAPNQQNLPRGEVEHDAEATGNFSPTSPSFHQTRLTRFLNNLALRPNDPPLDMSDAGHHTDRSNSGMPSILPNGSSVIHSPNLNPESDSFAYMETLLESLAVLGKLGTALDSVSQRLPGEIFSLVETTLDEVEDRAEYGKRRTMLSANEGALDRSEGIYVFTSRDTVNTLGSTAGVKLPLLDASTLRLSALESSSKRGDHEVLRDLFWTLYSKLDAVAQGLRIVSEVANRIGSRRDYRDSSGTKPTVLFPLSEIWIPVEVEVRRLINDYLTDEQRGSALSRNPISSINEILRDGRFSRDKIKPVFRFSDTDNKITNKALKQHEDGLIQVLKDTMPGLAPSGVGDSAQTIVTNFTDDHMLGSDQHHRLLIRPDAFHVTVLFQPTLSFLQQVSESLPSGLESARASSTVLDEFVLKVYLPQLEEKVLDLFHDAVTGPEAFQADPLSMRLCHEPLVKASTHLMALINSLCAMLRTSPFHRENYSRLILGVVIQFYQRCSDRFQALTTGEPEIGVEPRISLAAQWAQSSELHPCLSELMATDISEVDKQHQLCRQETHIEFELMGRKALVKEDLVPSIRNLAALSSLYRSVAWFSSKLKALKATPENIVAPTSPDSIEPSTGFTPATPYIPALPASDTLQLPLSREMTLRFQALLKTYEQLSGLILDTIRVDLRCRTMYHLDAAMRHGNYNSYFEATEPDSHIVDLNSELVQCDEFTSASLPISERQFVFAGLGHLVEYMLISNAHHLRLPNAFGIRKIIRNMLALQQSIKTLTNDQRHTEFERARRYYELFFLSPQEMLDGIRQRQSFSFDEYQTMLNFQCGVDTLGGETGVANATDRKYSLYMIDLHGLEIHSSNS